MKNKPGIIYTFDGNEPELNTKYRIMVAAASNGDRTGTIEAQLSNNTHSVEGFKKFGANTAEKRSGIIGQPVTIKGDFNFNTTGSWSGTVVLERNENESSWESKKTYTGRRSRNILFEGTELEDNVQYRINVVSLSAGQIDADLSAVDSTSFGIIKITSVESTTSATGTIVKPMTSFEPTKRWAEGAWSDVRGFPVAVTFLDGRCIYAKLSESLPTVWLSKVDDYENFEEGLNDADSFSLSLTTTNTIKWLKSLDVLVVGTSGDEWVIAPPKEGTVLTPTNFKVREQTTFGSKSIDAIPINESILFVDYVGRKLRQFTFDFDSQKFKANDMTSLAEHISISGFKELIYQRSPDSIIWAILNNGELKSFTYERPENVAAWAPMPMSGLVHSGVVIPGTLEDHLFIAIEREINGVKAIYIELFAPRFVAEQKDSFFVDSGVTETGFSNTISGLGHLEGETVSVLADGLDVGTFVVSSGVVTLNSPASLRHAGLKFASKLTPSRIDSKGSIQKTSELVFNFLRTRGTQYGFDEDSLFDVFEHIDGTDLYSGDVTLHFAGSFNSENQIIIFQDAPLPLVIRGIVSRVDITGR